MRLEVIALGIEREENKTNLVRPERGGPDLISSSTKSALLHVRNDHVKWKHLCSISLTKEFP